MVVGNRIGTNASGTGSLGNSGNGVFISTASNTVGGTGAGQGNVISSNGTDGVRIEGSSVTGNVVRGNFIGTNAAGNLDEQRLGNGDFGINIINASNNTIGGTTAAARNVISGNDGGGVSIGGSGNQVLGNYIGTNAAGDAALSNTAAACSSAG